MIKSFMKLCVALGAALLALGAQAQSGGEASGVVYTLSNAVDGNSVLTFKRNAHGALSAGPSYATGGTGSGGGLGNQGAIVGNGKILLAVNPGSDDISLFAVHPWGLKLLDTIPSGGVQPVSVTLHGRLVYALNAGSDNIAGFWIGPFGRLHALPGSERGLSGGGTGPAQIQFSPDGRALVVTEKATNKIVTFALDRFGRPDEMHVMDSAVPTPFGFDIARNGAVIVSEAAGGAPNASALSSYALRRTGELLVVSPGIGTTQTAACWVVITPDGRFAYTTNTGSDTISTYRVRPNGTIALSEAIGGSTGAGGAPTDAAISRNGRYLHVLNSGTQSIATFRIGAHGELRPVGLIDGLPVGATGLAAF
jgi:6-phosphogluconolactonase